MQDTPPSSTPSPDPSQGRWLRRALRISAGVVVVVVGGTAILGWVVRSVVRARVIPAAQAQLERVLERPVRIGDPRVSLPWSVRLGPSEVERLAQINGIGITADLSHWLTEGELGVNAQITRPQLDLDTPLGSNLAFNLDTNGGGGSLPLGQMNLQIVDGEVAIGSQPVVQGIQAQAQLELPQGEEGTPTSPFQITGQIQDSPFQIDGSADLQQGSGSAQLVAQQVPLDPVPALLPEDSPITLLGGDVDLDVQFDFAGGGPLQFEGEVELSSVSLGVEGLPFPLTGIEGVVLAQQGGERLQISSLEARYGEIPILVSGVLGLGEGENAGLDLQIQIPQVTIDQLKQGFDLDLPVAATGAFRADLQVTGSLDTPQVTGDIRSVTSGLIDQVPLSDLVAQFTYRDQQVQIEPIQLQLGGGQVQGSAQVQIGDQISAAGQLALSDLDLDQVLADYGVELPNRLGQLDAQLQIDAPGLQPTLNAQWQISEGEAQGQGQIQFADNTLSIPQTQVIIGADQGEITLTGQYASGLVQGDLGVEGIDLSFFREDVEGVVNAQIGLEGDIGGETSGLDLSGLNGRGTVTLPNGIQTQVAEEAIALSDPITTQLAWTGDALRLEQVDLGELGQAQGQIGIDPQTFELGALDLSIEVPGLDLQQLPLGIPPELALAGVARLQAQVSGSLQSPEVIGTAGLSGFQVAGLMFDDLQGPVRWQPGNQGGGIDLQATMAESSDQIKLELTPDLQQIAVALQQDQLQGVGSRTGDQIQARIDQFPLQVVSALAGDPEILSGELFTEISVDLAEQTAQAQLDVETLRLAQIEVREIFVDLAYADGQVGITEADLQLFESLYQARGSVTVPQLEPAFDQLTAALSGDPGSTEPTQAQPASDRSQQSDQTDQTDRSNQSNPPDPDSIPQLNLRISTTESRLQDIISTFKWQTWEDVTRRGLTLPPSGPAEILAPTENRGQPQAPLLAQLRAYLQEIRRRFEAQANQEESPLPPPTAIRGDFGFQAQISGPLTQPVVDLDFQGQNWQAEEFLIETVQIEGQYADQILTLQPLSLSTGERSTTFEGQLGLDRQSGQLQVTDLPLELGQRFLPEDVSLSGDFNTQLDLTGNLRDPQIEGEFGVNNTVVNGVPIEEATGQVGYDGGLWNLDSRILVVQDNQPVQISGQVPFTLPLAEVAADTEEITVDLVVEDEALQLINAFTDQVTWQEGMSQIDVTVRGTLQDPSVEGDLIVSDGVVTMAALGEPITDLNGRVDFNASLLEVPEFTAQVGMGTVSASGLLPINSRGAFSQRGEFQPLTVQLDRVFLDVPGLYQGQVDGQVIVGGILTRPLVEGQISASQGTVDLSPGEAGDPDGNTAAPPEETTRTSVEIEGIERFQDPLLDPLPTADGQDQTEEPLIPLRFGELDLVVGERIAVGWENFFSFEAAGDLLIGGSLNDIQPNGTISLIRGGIDLPIGGGFRLDRSESNTATFDPANGLDPFLDLQLITRVTEVSNPPGPQPVIQEGGRAPNVGSTQTIEIRAAVEGRASELSDADVQSTVISLSSLPVRDEGEILALLATTTAASIGTGAGLVGTASQGVLNTLGEAVGLDEVRIGPTFQVESDALSVSNVGLEAELVKDLTRSISISGSVPLTEPQPTRYNARYRLNPNTLLRLTTDLEDNDSAAIDFQYRF